MDNTETEKFKQKIRRYIELENVSVLTGAGTSYHLGVPTIRSIEHIKDFPEFPTSLYDDLKRKYFHTEDDSQISFEDLINCLQADQFLKQKKKPNLPNINKHLHKLQSWLLKSCDIEYANLKKPTPYDKCKNLLENKYYYHERMIKKFLQRSNNLKRVNLFTTNYDMAFDYALDNQGVYYANGFIGTHNRYFKPEVYNYDLYYPGQSVSGNVHRAEKVLRYYKLHGSLSWRSTKININNPYGIKEIPFNKDDIEIEKEERLIIYPCATKQSFALNLPYSELFRHFSQAINQPQSVLFCIGYSFHDEHINAIIHQALSIPSFTLIVVNYNDKENGEIESLKNLTEDKRIIMASKEIENQELTKFTEFVNNILPDLYEEKDNMIIAKTMNELYSKRIGEQHTNDNKAREEKENTNGTE